MTRRPDLRSLRNRAVFITGAASGIGRATALRAAADGARLYLTDLRAGDLEQTVAEIRASGGQVDYFRAGDISDYETVRAMGEEITAAHGAMDVVMNIAGISSWGTVQSLDHARWRAMVEVNLMGPIHVIETFLPPMIDAGRGGHLVNVSSAAGLIGMPWHAAYSASKFGLRGVSEVLRFDLHRHGIGVSLVCPGAVATGLTETIDVAGIDTTAPRFAKARAHFVKRAASPDEAAVAILRGVAKNTYWVYTSFDIRLAHWAQRMVPPAYVLAMRAFNAGANRALPEVGRARRPELDRTTAAS
ncbi:SDR family oxidoreductase [Nocardioides massiliensis]|uniref:NAD(P)-dependent dehydrogenase (Short-subunit alcohol dehydrogenase family) n=1 Tax=Nocardioides massiliensis TaxID=1325935 RepID=A0ABT9NTM9_9ACTN|nr:SDR family oxidoreductase [Nocardioides massiliensis]MDP9823205.1 NAD(P)-dependent dehydrogenase (short-subunit alcohol dehydrogenase family) [Nocardioides massiliensis]